MKEQLKYNIEELKKTATRTSLLYSDDRVLSRLESALAEFSEML